MSNRNFGGYITTGTVSANSTSVSGVWTLSQYMFQKANGAWPGSQVYSLFSGNPTSMGEGNTVTFYANTTNVLSNTRIYWTVDHLTSSANDFVETSNSFVISNNTGSFVVRTVADLTTEGSESFQLSLRQDSNTGPILTTSPTITISDTSLSPPPSIDFLLVGGGGFSYVPGSVILIGAAGGAGVLQANNFTGWIEGQTYTVSISGGNNGSSVFSGLFDKIGQISMSGNGGSGGATYSGTYGTAGSTTSATNGGGGATNLYWTTINSVQRFYLTSMPGATHSQSSANLYVSSQFPGVFTNYGGTGGNSPFSYGTTSSGSTAYTNWQWGGGGGGGASNTRVARTVNGLSIEINGGDGMLSSITGTPTYYGGGGGATSFFFSGGINNRQIGNGGLGGGATWNASGANGAPNTGGGGSNGGNGGSGKMIFRFLDSQLSATTTGSPNSSLDGLYRVLQFNSSGTIIFARK